MDAERLVVGFGGIRYKNAGIIRTQFFAFLKFFVNCVPYGDVITRVGGWVCGAVLGRCMTGVGHPCGDEIGCER